MEYNIRAKTSERMNYEAQARVIRDRIGDLEQIRQRLGYSKRKMAQILLIDPSTWVRWTKYGDSVPPHIYRALDWYLSQTDIVPKQENATEVANEDLHQKIKHLEQGVRNARVGLIMIAISALIMGFAFYHTLTRQLN